MAVMPSDELCQVEAEPCTRSRTNGSMVAVKGMGIYSDGETKFRAVTDEGFPFVCKFISGAVKKILKSPAITCGDRGQWMIHTKTGRWIVNLETKRKIPFRRFGNAFVMDAWARVPDKSKSKDKDKMEVDNVSTKKPGFSRPSKP